MGEACIDKRRLREILSAVSLRKVIHEELVDGWECQVWFGPSASKSTKNVTVLDYTMVAAREHGASDVNVTGDCLHFKEGSLETVVWTAQTMPILQRKISSTKPNFSVKLFGGKD